MPGDLNDKLESLVIVKEHALLDYAVYVKEQLALAAAHKQEEQKQAGLRRAAERRAARLHDIIEDHMTFNKLEDSRVKIGWRKSSRTEAENVMSLPDEYIRVSSLYPGGEKEIIEFIEYMSGQYPNVEESDMIAVGLSPDKNLIKEHLKEGIEVPGCRIDERDNLVIK